MVRHNGIFITLRSTEEEEAMGAKGSYRGRLEHPHFLHMIAQTYTVEHFTCLDLGIVSVNHHK